MGLPEMTSCSTRPGVNAGPNVSKPRERGSESARQHFQPRLPPCGRLSSPTWVSLLRPVVKLRNLLKPLLIGAIGMMGFLVADVGGNPLQVLGAEAHDSVSSLPFEHFSPASGAAIDLVRAIALKRADHFANSHR